MQSRVFSPGQWGSSSQSYLSEEFHVSQPTGLPYSPSPQTVAGSNLEEMWWMHNAAAQAVSIKLRELRRTSHGRHRHQLCFTKTWLYPLIDLWRTKGAYTWVQRGAHVVVIGFSLTGSAQVIFLKLKTEIDSFSDSLEEDLEGEASLSCLRRFSTFSGKFWAKY